MAIDTQDWTGRVEITGTPTVLISGTVSVNVANTPAVTIAGTASVNIANTPSVNIAGTASVAIANTPTVTISGTVAATISSGTVNVQTGAGVTIQAAGTLRNLGSVAWSGNGTFTLNFTLQTYERAVVAFVQETGRVSANPTIEVKVGTQAGTVVTLDEGLVNAGQPNFIPTGGAPIVAYANPALTTAWRLQVITTNNAGGTGTVYVFADTTLPDVGLVGEATPLPVALTSQRQYVDTLNPLPVNQVAPSNPQGGRFATSTNATPNTITTHGFLPAAGVGFAWRLLWVTLTAQRTITTTSIIQVFIRDDATITRPVDLAVHANSPYASIVFPGLGIQFPENGQVVGDSDCNNASQGFVVNMGYVQDSLV